LALNVGDILKVVTIMSWLDGNIMENVFALEIIGSGGPFDDLDVVDDMVDYADEMYTNINAHISNNVDGSEVKVYVYDAGDDDFDEVGSAIWGWDPIGTQENMPSGVALLLNCRTTDPDVNGKKYLGGVTEEALSDGILVAGLITTMAAFSVDWVSDFIGATSGAEFLPGVWSPTRTAFVPMSGTVFIPSVPAYQRRRKTGVGI
jgi:hypothetical protein